MTKSSIQASLSPLFKVHLTTALIRGESRKFRNGRPGHLPAIYMHTIYLTEHSLKLIQNFKEKKGWPRSTQPNPKSVHADVLEGTPVSAGETKIEFFFASRKLIRICLIFSLTSFPV